jgi:membrane-bound serine protease (ClpP class)
MKKLALTIVALLTLNFLFANDSTFLVYQFNIMEQIAPSVWRQTKKVFAEADSLNADLILIRMNTYGGTVVDADSIRTKIINSNIPVWVFIDNNAASAGALISIACDSIFMRSGANIGAATVVNQTGEKAPDKYQSYFRSIMRSTAQSHGADTIINGKDTIIKWFRDPIMAEAMVDEDVYIAGIVDTGKILTFTAIEAMENGFCEGMAENVDDLLRQANINNYEIKEFKPTTIDRIIGFLTNPVISGILIMAILGGIYFEMQTPGIGFPLVIAILAAIGYFAPLYLEGLAENWEILVFIVGLILIAVEIFVIPGFGIAGVLGISFTFAGLTLSLLNNVRFNFDHVEGKSVIFALLTVTLSLTFGFFLSLWLSRKMFTAQTGPFSKLALNSVQLSEEGFVGVDVRMREMVGKTGVAHSMLRPSGKVNIDGDIWDAMSEESFIDKGEKIIVHKQEAGQLYVVKSN